MTRGGDCDDANASAYPGAPDAAGDGRDLSCDGSDGLAPSVGLPTSTFTTLQAAMDAAAEGQTVWVGPGTYREYGLTMKGKALRLVSTEGETATIIDAQNKGTLFYFDEGETEESVLEGFTLTRGDASCNTPVGATSCFCSGGGIFMDNTSPTLTHVTFMGNMVTYGSGGGMFLRSSSPTLTHVTFTGNTASSYYGDGYGGGMSLFNSSPTLKHCILAYNQAGTSGGNLYQLYNDSTVTAQYSLIYNPAGWKEDTITPSGTYLTVEPKFLDYANSQTGASCIPGTSTTCLPADLHPALGSPLINAGDPAQQDVDGSRADIGSYGGSGGDQWDVDMDGTPDYFWPGERSDAPSGFNPADYDLDDLDADVQ